MAGDAEDLRGGHLTDVVKHPADAVIIGVAHVDMHILSRFIEQTAQSTRLVEGCRECLPILKAVLVMTAAQPTKDLVAERVNDLNFVVIGVRHQNNILLRDEMYA